MIQNYAQKLSKEGGRLILVGQTVRIILPDNIILNPCSANLIAVSDHVVCDSCSPKLNSRYDVLLDNIAQLMRELEAISVQIAGYTNCKTSYTLNKALSKRQAEVLGEYLFERGLDARLVHTVGYATQDPLVANVHSVANRRAEISFQYLPLLKQY